MSYGVRVDQTFLNLTRFIKNLQISLLWKYIQRLIYWYQLCTININIFLYIFGQSWKCLTSQKERMTLFGTEWVYKIHIRNLHRIKHILANNKGVFCYPANSCIYLHKSTMHANYVLCSVRVKSVCIPFLAAPFLYVASRFIIILFFLCFAASCVFSRPYDLAVILI